MAVFARRAALVAIALAAVLPVVLAEWPPLYDYYHWVFHGHIMAALLRGVDLGAEPLTSLYELNLRPVPNMAVSLGMTALNFAFDPAVAGRVFLAAMVLLFGFGFRALSRVLQGRPTVIEYVGFA